MNENYARVEKINNQGYDIEFGTVLENAFNNYKKIAGIGGLAMLIVVLIVIIIIMGLLGIFFGFSEFASTITGLQPQALTGSGLLGMFAFSVIMAGLGSPINAGFIKMAYQARHEKPFGIETIFEYYKSSYFKELFIASVVIAIFGNGVNYLLNYFGIFLWGSLFTYIVAFLTFLTIPLITFANLNAMQAISMSINLVFKQPLILLGLLIVAFLFACLGIFGFCIGLFFTLPFLYSMYFTIYDAIIPTSEDNALDEIGQQQE